MFKVRNKKTYAKHVRKRPNINVKPLINKPVDIKVEKDDMKLADVLLEKKQILPKEEKKVEETATMTVEEPIVVETEENGEETPKPTPKRKPRKPKTENNETKE